MYCVRKITDSQISSRRLDSLVDEITEARGVYPTLNERLENNTGARMRDYMIESAVIDGGTLTITVKPGLAYIEDAPIATNAALTLSITPSPAQDYYVYLTGQGELYYNTAFIKDAEKVILGKVSVNQDGTGASITDMRPFLQKGGAAGEIYAARGGYATLGERLDAGDASLSNLASEVTGARGGYPVLGNRLDAIAAALGEFAFKEDHVSQDGQTVFALSRPYPFGFNKLRVYVDGLLMTAGLDADYVETDEYTVTFNYPLTAGRNVLFIVENTAPTAGFKEVHIAEVGQSVFTLSNSYPAGEGRLRVYVNGVLYHPGQDNDYLETDEHTVTFNTSFPEPAVVQFILESSSLTDSLAAGGYPTIGGRLNSQLGDCNVDISFQYDTDGQLLMETWTGDVNKTIQYTYNDRGLKAVEIESEGRLTITRTYTYDSNNRVTSISVRRYYTG